MKKIAALVLGMILAGTASTAVMADLQLHDSCGFAVFSIQNRKTKEILRRQILKVF